MDEETLWLGVSAVSRSNIDSIEYYEYSGHEPKDPRDAGRSPTYRMTSAVVEIHHPTEGGRRTCCERLEIPIEDLRTPRQLLQFMVKVLNKMEELRG